MNFRASFILVSLLIFASTPSANAARDVRVGIVTIQSYRGEMALYQPLFRDFTRASRGVLKFQVAAGSYGEVLAWLRNGHIDIAVLSPGLYAEIMNDRDSSGPLSMYLATIGRPSPAASPGSPYVFEYRSACLVRDKSNLRSSADVMAGFRAGKLQPLFVHPLSVSGRIAPEFMLRKLGVSLDPDRIQYTYSHRNSTQLVAERLEGREPVAFVWDDEGARAREGSSTEPFRAVAIPELEALAIPGDAVVARRGFRDAALVERLLLQHEDAEGHHAFRRVDDAETRYAAVRGWMDELHLAPDIPEYLTVTLAEILGMFEEYVRQGSEARPFRLAVVLAGGGAKCAFEVGALAAIEEALRGLRESTGDSRLDIALVVGTSGGAINAVPTALGITATPEGIESVGKAWDGFDQRDLVRLSPFLEILSGFWQTCLVVWLGLFIGNRAAGRRRRAFIACVIIWAGAAFLILLGSELRPSWSRLGTNHTMHHLFLLLTLGARWGGWILLVAGALLLVYASRRSLKRVGLEEATPLLPRLRIALIFGAVAIPLLHTWTALFVEKTLCSGAGVETVYAEQFSRLVMSKASEEARVSRGLAGSAAETLKSLSGIVNREGLLKRDLVVTASCLSRTASLPNDLYFHLASRGSRAAPPAYGAHGVALADHPSLLFDVVMGSGSVFPVFPPRLISDFPGRGDRVELIDGAFAHNSPVEAAVKWGATHVIVLEVSPDAERQEMGHLVGNTAGALEYLYGQAQLLDARARERDVAIFTLRPSPPQLCMLDFADNLVRGAIEKGYREARGERLRGSKIIAGQPSFRKELHHPLFVQMGER